MNYQEIQDEVLVLVDSGTPAMDLAIPSLVNEAFYAIANEPGIVLPDLKRIVSVNTVLDQAYTSIPDGYTGKLLYATCGGVPINVDKTLEELMTDYVDLTEVGDVESLIVEGSTLWYVKIPETVTAMTLLLYASPTPLVAAEDVPTVIPKNLHRDLFVSYCAYTMFDKLEQGEDGSKVNYLTNLGKYNKAVTKLREFIAARRRGFSRSAWNY